MICPTCGGSGETRGIACSTAGCHTRTMKCFTCRGVGKISTEGSARMELSEMIRKDRIARSLTIRDEGKRLDVDFAEWSRIEAGRLPETERGRKALATRYQELNLAQPE